MLESQLNPFDKESKKIKENKIMQLLTDEEANNKSNHNEESHTPSKQYHEEILQFQGRTDETLLLS